MRGRARTDGPNDASFRRSPLTAAAKQELALATDSVRFKSMSNVPPEMYEEVVDGWNLGHELTEFFWRCVDDVGRTEAVPGHQESAITAR